MATILTYEDVETYLSGKLASTYAPLPFFDPGPDADTVLQDQAPDRLVMIVVGSGPGLSTENVFDRSIVHIRSVGLQTSHADAQQLAQAVDKAMVALDTSQLVNGKWTLSVVRSGGSPSLLVRDDGDRYHFTCNYVWEVQY